jgi:hypothetical protein
MQVYGLIGQTEEGIWPEAQLFAVKVTDFFRISSYMQSIPSGLENSFSKI